MKPLMTKAVYLLATAVFSALTGIGVWICLVGIIGIAGMIPNATNCIAYGVITTGLCGYICAHCYEKATALTSRKKSEAVTMTGDVNLALRKAA
jgi:hypothetical protein